LYSYEWKKVFNPGEAEDFFENAPSRAFEPQTINFSQTNAWWLSEFSRLIYARGQEGADETVVRNRFLHGLGLTEHWFFNGKYLQCAIITANPKKNTPFSVLVFRGTAGTITNWLYNLNATLSPWPSGGKVHTGFKQLFLEAWEEIERHLKALHGPVYYTGHSLGGAFAVLCASLHQPHAVYTFGAPRIGNEEFIQSVRNVSVYRVANRKDIVTAIPPIPNMLHVGEAQYLDNSRNHPADRSWFSAPEFLAAHSPANYSVHL
jgi:pimeloyl-ACP methyl ester carboxylesterase